MITIEEIRSLDRFLVFQPIWDSICQAEETDSPFLSHSWFRCCIESFGRGKTLSVLVFKDGNDILGFAPFWRYPEKMRGMMLRNIGFINGPDTASADFVLRTDRRQEILEALIDFLFGIHWNHWDVLSLGQWPEESANYSSFLGILDRRQRKYMNELSSLVPYIPIRGDWDAYLQGKSARFRKTRRNIVNRVEKLQAVEIRCHRRDPDGAVFREILDVSRRSWKEKEGIAITSREDVTRFFELLGDVSESRGWLRAWVLKTNGTPIAMEYDLEHKGKIYALRADFDETHKECSPGAYLEFRIIQSLFGDGCLEYNAGPGLNTYKLQWTEEYKKNRILKVFNRNPKTAMVFTVETRLVPFVRRLKRLIRSDSGSNPETPPPSENQ